MIRSLALLLTLSLCAPALAQEAPAEERPERVKLQLSDQVEDLLRALRDGKTEVATGILEGWKPTEADLKAAFNEAGVAALGPKVLAAAEETFAGTPAEIAERLQLDVKKLAVTVLAESTEGLESMAYGSHAAQHFASGLRAVTPHFNKQLQWYAVMMLEREAPEDAVGETLQVFCRCGDRFVYFGKLWRLGDDDSDEGSDEGSDDDSDDSDDE